MFIIQIVPRLPPETDGIGDHALRLAERLKAEHSIESGFLVADPDWNGAGTIGGFPVVRLKGRSRGELLQALDKGFTLTSSPGCKAGILLQFAPYGYERRGCPRWLAQGLSDYRGTSTMPVMLMLHELDAAGTGPLNSAFWLSALQRQIIRKLVSRSEATFTNTAFHRNRLLSWNVTRVISLLPSFSTIGEPLTNKGSDAREKQIVVFGRPSQRRMAYGDGASDLEAACIALGAERIIDIGHSLDGERPIQIRNIPIVYKGRLPASDVSKIMESSLGSFLRYPEALLTKSSIYAGSCAHGTIPFVSSVSEGTLRDTELSEGLDYISLRKETSFSKADIETLSALIFARYQTRCTSAAARQIADVLTRQR